MYISRNLAAFCCILVTTFANAKSFCFLQAEGYYEQIYCEVQAEGRGSDLPAFLDFKKNDATTQALLLKRPASKAGTKLAMPKQTSRVQRPKHQVPQKLISKQGSRLNSCHLLGATIDCQSTQYSLIGNKANKYLAKNVLKDTNHMSLPSYQGSLGQKTALNHYLTKAYRQYIKKMLDIGLGGVTMSYTKFGYIFNDLAEKNVHFSERFEKMYGFLKKDKRSINVNQSVVADKQLTLSDCSGLSNELIICERTGRNYVYQRKTPITRAAR